MKLLSGFMMLFAIFLWIGPVAQATELVDLSERAQMDSAQTSFVTGMVKDVQGDWCLVQDPEGKEWKIQVDGYTETIGNVLPGVTIMAMVEPNGHAKEVRVLSN